MTLREKQLFDENVDKAMELLPDTWMYASIKGYVKSSDLSLLEDLSLNNILEYKLKSDQELAHLKMSPQFNPKQLTKEQQIIFSNVVLLSSFLSAKLTAFNEKNIQICSSMV